MKWKDFLEIRRLLLHVGCGYSCKNILIRNSRMNKILFGNPCIDNMFNNCVVKFIVTMYVILNL